MTWPRLMNLPSHAVVPAGALDAIGFFIIAMTVEIRSLLPKKFELIVCNDNNSTFDCFFMFPPSSSSSSFLQHLAEQSAPHAQPR